MKEYTPIMKQYIKIKSEHKDKILFFRMGDFYEFFFNDAKTVSEILSITLTSRGEYKGKKIPMAGFPKHASNYYIQKLIKQNKKIAICEQIGEIKKNGLIERKVIKIITPGTFITDDINKENDSNYICAIIKHNNEYGIAFLDLITSTFFTHQVNTDFELYNEIDKLLPKEIIIHEEINIKMPNNILVNKIKEKKITYNEAINIIKKIIINIHEKNIINVESSILAAGMLIKYIIETKNKIQNINTIDINKNKELLYMDHNTRHNLEIINNISENKNNSLINAIDNTSTIMGKRLLKKWLLTPTTSKKVITDRLTSVSILKQNQTYTKIEYILKNVMDIEKITYNIITYNIKPIELKNLQTSLENINKIKIKLEKISTHGILKEIFLNISDHTDIINLIKKSILDVPATSIKDGYVLKEDYDKQLDKDRNFINNIDKIINEEELREKKNITFQKIKISFNSKDGYYIDLPNTINNLPEYYKKIKSLSNSNRFKTTHLEEIEKNILTCKNKAISREKRLYMIIIYKIKKKVKLLKNTSLYISILDVINCFAKNSSLFNWTEPNISKQNIIKITDGRHPIIEKYNNNQFIPNDLYLDNNKKTIIITGANMGGKSTYMRQTAIIVLLAHIGSHVPAKEATIGKISKIITRIGANDDIANSYSTFMLEMNEISNIIEMSDKNSLVLIDEIGRGTNYLEGKALAISILDELTEKNKPFMLFSTHFHDLFKFIINKNYIKNIFFKTNEIEDNLIFLYKWEEGISNKSFGINIAKKAGLHNNLINNAKKNLDILKKEELNTQVKEAINIIQMCNPDLITPIEALNKIYLIKKILENKT
ncbi:MAG TPA: DNA mismatch repair protein MutS [Candidatus Azoamicus sp. MARI]